jgi:DNA-directed RNA polymerase subunit alpha
MSDYTIVLPSKPRIVKEEGVIGLYEIDGLYPGYGQTLGNSLRRIILSSLPGAAITEIKIKGVSHEFSTIPGVKEDVITMLLNIKKVRIKMLTDEPQTLSFKIKGPQKITAADIVAPGQIEVQNPDQYIAEVTDKGTELDVEMRVERGLGYVPKEVLQKNRVDIGVITLDSFFTPIRRVSYEVEDMRVGDRTNFNRLRIHIETDGTITPKEALEMSIETMIQQLRAIVGFKEEELPMSMTPANEDQGPASDSKSKEIDTEFLKTRIEALGLSSRTLNALSNANVRTVGGLARKKEEDLLEIEGMGAKGIEEIKKALSHHGLTLKA